MGGRGSGSSSSKVSVGQKVSVSHSAYGTVKGTVSHVNSDGSFSLKNPRGGNGRAISKFAVFQSGNVK